MTYVGVTALAAALSSSAFAGEYVPSAPDYKSVSAACSSSATGPALGDLQPVTDVDNDPTITPGQFPYMRTRTSTATFEWAPARVGDTPANYKIRQDFKITANISADRKRDPRGGASARADTTPSILNKVYVVSADSSDPNRDQPPIREVDTPGDFTDSGIYPAQAGAFIQRANVGALANTSAWATTGGSGSSSNSITITTTKISLVVVPPAT